jgi:hypothetical protein
MVARPPSGVGRPVGGRAGSAGPVAAGVGPPGRPRRAAPSRGRGAQSGLMPAARITAAARVVCAAITAAYSAGLPPSGT